MPDQDDDAGSEEGAELQRLRARVADSPGCAEFPALAELERRAGRADEARRIAERGLALAPEELAGRVVLALVHLDQGDRAEARIELAGFFSGLPGHGDAEPDAPRSTKPEPGSPSTSENAPVDAPEKTPRTPRSGSRPPSAELPVGEGSSFRTRTMARLLERQGDRGRAEEILDELGSAPLEGGESDAENETGGEPEARVRETLERWLRNLQGEQP
ncbi:MAG: hypothetical protein OSB70_13540 [Myxococcota bacterium]|nr:hypothetical protein [Myxococcota bacterium]